MKTSGAGPDNGADMLKIFRHLQPLLSGLLGSQEFKIALGTRVRVVLKCLTLAHQVAEECECNSKIPCGDSSIVSKHPWLKWRPLQYFVHI